jgi:hypothetical protein
MVSGKPPVHKRGDGCHPAVPPQRLPLFQTEKDSGYFSELADFSAGSSMTDNPANNVNANYEDYAVRLRENWFKK